MSARTLPPLAGQCRAQVPAQELASAAATLDQSGASNASQRGTGEPRWVLALAALVAALGCSKQDPCSRDRELYDSERSRAAASSWVLLARDNLLRCVCPAAHSHASAFPSRASAEALELCAEQRGVQ